MAARVGTTADASRRNFIAVYGASGVGKTSLLHSMNASAIEMGGAVLQIDCDDGNLAVKDMSYPSVGCDYLQDVYDVLGWVEHDPNWQKFTHIMIDGGSALGESILQQYLQIHSHPQKAYGELISAFLNFIAYIKRVFKDKIIVMTFQQKYMQDDVKRMFYSLDLPGQKLAPQMPYRFDEVLCLRIMPDSEGKQQRVLQAQPDMTYDAKDRSGKLAQFNPADMQHVINQIRAV